MDKRKLQFCLDLTNGQLICNTKDDKYYAGYAIKDGPPFVLNASITHIIPSTGILFRQFGPYNYIEEAIEKANNHWENFGKA